MTPGEWIAAIGLGITVVTIILAFIRHETSSLRNEMQTGFKGQDAGRHAMRAELREIIDKLDGEVQQNTNRITRLETIVLKPRPASRGGE